MFRLLLSVCALLISTVALSQVTTLSAEPKSPGAPHQVMPLNLNKAFDPTNPAQQPNSSFLALATSVPVTYPEVARQTNIQGYVVVKITVNENGNIESVENVSGDPGLVGAVAEVTS